MGNRAFGSLEIIQSWTGSARPIAIIITLTFRLLSSPTSLRGVEMS